jgi:gliding motility-associated-like protein
LSIAGRDTVCINGAEQYSGVLALPDSTIKWKWTFGNGTTAQTQNPSVTYSNTGDYDIQLIATNKLACADTTSLAINVVPLPTVSAVADPLQIISGSTVQLNMNYSGPIVSYNWLPATGLSCVNCPTPEAKPQFTTKYTVDVADRFGCKNRGFVTVKVICTGQNFFVPNSFSPNGDGVNDIFYLRGSGLFRVKTLRVFSRWGEVVFEKTEVPVNSPSHGWDGRFKGKKAKADVYVYQLEIICSNGELLTYSGNVALIL